MSGFLDKRARQRFMRHRGAQVGLALCLVLLVIGLLGPWLAPHDPNQQFTDLLLRRDGLPKGPGDVPGFPLGADGIARDELSRLLHGGRISLLVALVATLIAVSLGLFIGVLTGYMQGAFDSVMMRCVDLFLSLPFLLIVIALQRMVDSPSLLVLASVLGFLSWTTLARVVRAKTMQVRSLPFVEACRALGLGHTRILLRHVLPNVLGPAVVIGTALVAQMVLVESAMSFLGFGVRPPQASWGSMLREGEDMLAYVPHLVFLPGLLIVATVFGFNLLGEGLRDAFDPKE